MNTLEQIDAVLRQARANGMRGICIVDDPLTPVDRSLAEQWFARSFGTLVCFQASHVYGPDGRCIYCGMRK